MSESKSGNGVVVGLPPADMPNCESESVWRQIRPRITVNVTNPNSEPRAGAGLAITGMVLAIIGCPLSFVPCIQWIGMFLAFLGIIFSGIGLLQSLQPGGQGTGMAIAGLILSLLTCIWVPLFYFLFWMTFWGFIRTMFGAIPQQKIDQPKIEIQQKIEPEPKDPRKKDMGKGEKDQPVKTTLNGRWHGTLTQNDLAGNWSIELMLTQKDNTVTGIASVQNAQNANLSSVTELEGTVNANMFEFRETKFQKGIGVLKTGTLNVSTVGNALVLSGSWVSTQQAGVGGQIGVQKK